MKNYVKILDTPNISAFEWIHRVQEELMDGIVYLEKLKEILKLNMRELDAARIAAMKETETKSTSTDDENDSILDRGFDGNLSRNMIIPLIELKLEEVQRLTRGLRFR